jgi:dienelactone hydrolase
MVPANFTNDAGLNLYGEILLPYRGAVPPGDGPFPVIIALDSLISNVAVYRWWHAAFADAGYLVFAFDFSGQGHSEGTDDDRDAYRVTDTSRALTWLLEESPVKDFVDAERVGVIGHSLGAITTLEVQAVDDRFKAAVAAAPIHEGQSNFDSADIPIMIQTGDHDGPVAPVPFVNPVLLTRTVYDKLEADRAMIVAEAASHAQHTNSPLLPSPTWGREIAGLYSVAWMDYYLRGDESALDDLLSSHPHLSSLNTSDVEIDGTIHVLREGSFGP